MAVAKIRFQSGFAGMKWGLIGWPTWGMMRRGEVASRQIEPIVRKVFRLFGVA
jgi:hypothetical protein